MATLQQSRIRYLAIDLETTGLNSMVHTVCQIGAVFFDTVDFLDTFEADLFVNLSRYAVEQSALDVNRFTRQRLQEGRNVSTVLRELEEAVSKIEPQFDSTVFVFHNAPFDVSFLSALLEANGGLIVYPHLAKGLRRPLDTITMAHMRFPDRDPMSLSEIVRAVLPKGYAWQKHDALADARTTAQVAITLMNKQRRLVKSALEYAGD